jgi:methionyl-tRNA formyltransferase
MTIALACSKLWRRDLAERLATLTGRRCHLITERAELTPQRLSELDPEWVFLPHWSHLVPREVHERWPCVIFHMTDLPFGRGGSPLQNLIARGMYETKISALRCTNELDAGPIYLKAPLSLHGSAQEIFLRATDVIEGMIVRMVSEKPAPQPQKGEVTNFARRAPQDGDLAALDSLERVFDWIRMLDADGYPNAFVEVGRWRFEFSRASLRGPHILADVKITERKNGS